ncbi:LOB domain-containing protein 12-like [Primulina tabacum]|uniref:LOB domain-containing protein 12-like n=1 Tax=Primulina tabacum TaxID=48773 RepID=UPI003F5A1DF4
MATASSVTFSWSKCLCDPIYTASFASEKFSRLLISYDQELPVNRRTEAADSLFFEAQCRLQDPVYGCVGTVTILHQQIHDAQCQLARIQAQIAALSAQSAQQNQFHHHHQVEVTPTFNPISSPAQYDVANTNNWFNFNLL